MSNFNDKDFDDFGSEFDESFELDKKLENSGSGFAVEDDVDASSMLEESMRYSENDPNDSLVGEANSDSSGETTASSTSTPVKAHEEVAANTVSKNDEVTQGVGVEAPPRHTSDGDSLDGGGSQDSMATGGATLAQDHINPANGVSVHNEAPAKIESEPEVNSNVEYSRPSAPQSTASSSPQQDSRPRITVPNNETELKRVSTIINILDAYRKLSSEERTVVSQFVNNGNPINNESEFVISVLNVDRMLARTIIALREAKSKDPVERAFYVIELDENVLYALGSLVEVFTNNAININVSKTQYARELVKSIEMLDQTSMRFVEATETVLKVVEA